MCATLVVAAHACVLTCVYAATIVPASSVVRVYSISKIRHKKPGMQFLANYKCEKSLQSSLCGGKRYIS